MSLLTCIDAEVFSKYDSRYNKRASSFSSALHKKYAKALDVSGFAAAQCCKAMSYRSRANIVVTLRLHVSEAQS